VIAAVTLHSLAVTFIHRNMYMFFLSLSSLSFTLLLPKTRFLTLWAPFTSLTHKGTQYRILICVMNIQLTSLVLSVLKVWVLWGTAELGRHLCETSLLCAAEVASGC